MFVFKGFKLWSSSGLRTLSKSKAVGGKYCIVLPGERHEFQLSTKDTLISRFYKRVISAAFYLTLFTCKIICFLMWRSTSLYNSRIFSLQLRLFGLFALRWTKSHRLNWGFDSSFTLLSIASSPGIFSISSNIGNKCAQFAQIYNNDPRSIISKSF